MSDGTAHVVSDNGIAVPPAPLLPVPPPPLPVPPPPARAEAPNADPTPWRKPPKSRARAAIAWAGMLPYGAIVLLATVTPTPIDKGYGGAIHKLLDAFHKHGLPGWFGYAQVEFFANVAMYIPLGFFIGLILARKRTWLGFCIIPVISGTIELIQGIFLSERYATIQDVIANSLGGWSGVAVAILMRAVVRSRDKKVLARALWERSANERP